MTDPRDFRRTTSLPRVRPQFAVWPALRSVRAPRDTWFFRAGGTVAAALIPLAVLAIFGRLDLATYTMAGSMTALFTHALPYRRRAGTIAGFVGLLTLACGIAMAAAATSDNVLWRIVVASVLAAIIKVAHDASNVGIPSPVIPIFLVSAIAFTPQTWPTIPLHVGLIAASGAVSWLVLMSPVLVRRDGPERRAVATAMLATIPVGEDPDDAAARDRLAAAITAAWRTLSFTRGRDALEAHLVACERILVDPSVSRPDRARANARTIERSRTAIPAPPLTDDERAEIRGAHIALAAPRTFGERHPILWAFRPSSSSMPFFWRLLAASLCAALASWAFGGERPFWAITAASVIVQPNLLMTWRKAPPRALGAIVGVGLFALLAPMVHAQPIAAAGLILVLTTLTEAFVARNYFIAQVFITPMALLMSQFGAEHPTGELVAERMLDTMFGIVAGLLAAFAIRNRHLRRHAKDAIERLEAASRIPDDLTPGDVHRARRDLVAALAAVAIAVRATHDEWWTRRVDETRVLAAQRRAHQVLATLD